MFAKISNKPTFYQKNPRDKKNMHKLFHLNQKVVSHCEIITSMKCEKQGFWCLYLFITTERDGKRREKYMSGNRKYLSFSQHPPPVPSIFLFLRFSDLYHFDISKEWKILRIHKHMCEFFSLCFQSWWCELGYGEK